jgi:hypothetical protein
MQVDFLLIFLFLKTSWRKMGGFSLHKIVIGGDEKEEEPNLPRVGDEIG